MKDFLRSKLAVGIIAFCLGFFASQIFSRITYKNTLQMMNAGSTVQLPVNPNDFDHNRLIDAVKKLHGDISAEEAAMISANIGEVQRREDDQFVYYDIPLTNKEKNDSDLKIMVNGGVIRIIESTENIESMREFAIEQGLDESQAKVINISDKLSIKIPKKATI